MILVAILWLACVCNMGAGSALDEAKQFFNTYTNLYGKFDPAVADLYSDEAAIKNKRHLPDGTAREMSLPAKTYKELIRKTMPLAKERGDTSNYTNVQYKEESGKVRIECQRYSELKKYTSPLSLVIAKNGERWLIVEELSESKQ